MKIFTKVLLSFLALFLWQTPALARDNVTDWYIKDFQVEIDVNYDSSLSITEKILADCGTAVGKHGIFRILPKNYRTQDGNFDLPTKLISITDDQGRKLEYKVVEDSETISYQIGDKNIEVSGENFYEIKYEVKNTIRTENPDFDELYWNILGSFWDLEIDKFTARINFPSEINKDNTEVYYYAGAINSKEHSAADYNWRSNNVLEFVSLRPLATRESITVSASFPKNIITPYVPSLKDKYGYSLFVLILFLLFPLITFIACFKLWKKHGRDPRHNKTITPEFEIPENLTPMEMGGIMKKGRLHPNSVTATIIHLGVLGYLQIEKIEQKIVFVTTSDFKLIRTSKAMGPDLYEAEKAVLDQLFEKNNEVKLQELKLTFHKSLKSISELVLSDLATRDFVSEEGANYRKYMIGAAVTIYFVVAVIQLAVVSLMFCAAIILIFGLLMDRYTIKGAEMNWRIKGFELYMETAEKYRSRFQEEEGALEKLLPYAILFGITKKWLKKMKDIYGETYFENYHPAFMIGALSVANFDNFTESIDQISSSMAASVSPSSSGAGGGGGSGGGGGGGGGGGW